MSESKNKYDKMPEYIEAVFNIFKSIHKKSNEKKDNKLKMISLTIYNYVLYMSKINKFTLSDDQEVEVINMIPIFEYISHNNIELYDFSTIDDNDIDVNKKEDLERFVLTHIYYITQSGSL
jgi:hypothetical protein